MLKSEDTGGMSALADPLVRCERGFCACARLGSVARGRPVSIARSGDGLDLEGGRDVSEVGVRGGHPSAESPFDEVVSQARGGEGDRMRFGPPPVRSAIGRASAG